jgi:hypothetical protein
METLFKQQTSPSSVRFARTKLPWNLKPVRCTYDLNSYLATYLQDLGCYLPSSVTLFVDDGVESYDTNSFLKELPQHLKFEIEQRYKRQKMLIDLSLFNEQDIFDILTKSKSVQHWALYYSKEGGLNQTSDSIDTQESWGVLPCSSMPNHGVAWKKTSDDYYKIWLATARKTGQDWDWDSDIGHESAHASFAPIPLFAQALHINPDLTNLANIDTIEDLSLNHLARMTYTYLEVAVIAMRGEQRHTETGLPVVEQPDELYSFLRLSHELMPNLGFDRALSMCKSMDGKIDPKNDVCEMLTIATPIMRVLPHISKVINCSGIPSIEWYKSILK